VSQAKSSRRTLPRSVPTVPEPTPEERAQDASWERELIRLLSGLEFLRAELEELVRQKKSAGALENLVAMVDHVVKFAERHVDAAAATNLPTLLAKAGDLYSSLRQALEERDGSSLKSLFGWFTKTKDDKLGRQHSARSTIEAVKEVLQSAFELFEAGFRSPANAQQWAQTWQVFLADLAPVLDKLKY
jgi:hypothetical protein